MQNLNSIWTLHEFILSYQDVYWLKWGIVPSITPAFIQPTPTIPMRLARRKTTYLVGEVSISRFVMVVFMFRAEFLGWENKILLSCKFYSKMGDLVVKMSTPLSYSNRYTEILIYWASFKVCFSPTCPNGYWRCWPKRRPRLYLPYQRDCVMIMFNIVSGCPCERWWFEHRFILVTRQIGLGKAKNTVTQRFTETHRGSRRHTEFHRGKNKSLF